jgi:serine protease inhibitor
VTTSSLSPRVRALALLSMLVACGDPVGPVEVDPITELPRALSVAETELITRSNHFGIELLRETLAGDDRANVILSPLSASMALGMTLNGADGDTFDAIRGGLGFGELDQLEINEAYSGLIALLTELDPTVRFDIANSVWARDGVPFHDSFFDAVSAAFDAEAEILDFGDPASVDVINGWVDEKTNGFIDSIVDQLDPALVMLLINAIYFDGTWTNSFDPADTRAQPFQRADGSTVSVEMMSISEVELGFGSGVVGEAGYTAVDLPYGGGAFSMLVVVPHGDVRELAAELDDEAFAGVTTALTATVVDGVSIPKFELSYDALLNDALKRMGMEVAFTPAADFTRLSPMGDQLCIGFVRQKTFMEVDEVGTRAAAVTAVGIGLESFTGLVADRPFLLAIRERLSGTVLFLGVVGDPTAEDPGPEGFENTCF